MLFVRIENSFVIYSVYEHSSGDHVAPLVCTIKFDGTCLDSVINLGAAVDLVRFDFSRSI